MSKIYLDFSNYKNTLQLDREDHLAESAMSLTNKQKLSLYKKSQKSGYSTDILEEVYRRGHMIWKAELFEGTREQFAFDRVNSFISGGFAAELDADLTEKEVWDTPNPKQKAGKSEKLSPAGKAKAKARAKAAGRPYPNMVDNIWAARNEETEIAEAKKLRKDPWDKMTKHLPHLKASQEKAEAALAGLKQAGKDYQAIIDKEKEVKTEEYTGSEVVSKNPNKASSRFIGTKSLADVYKKDTPGEVKSEETITTIKRVVNEATYKGRKVSLNKPFRTPGGPKKSAVYVDPDGDGKAKIVRFGDPNLSIKKDQPARKRSYCARSSGQGNLNKKDSANYWSRKAWDC